MQRRQVLPMLASLAVFGSAERAVAQGTLEKVRVAGPPTEDATNLYYAIKTGMFGRTGLDVEMIAIPSGAAAVAAVIAGTYDLARTSLMPIIDAYLRGIPVAIVAPDNLYTPRNPFSLLQIASDAPYKTGSDLSGKTIGTPSIRDFNMLATRAWVDKHGGDWRSLKFVEVPNSAMEAAIVQHRIDAGVMQTAQLDASLAAGTTKTLGDALSAIAPAFISGVYMVRRDWANAHADAVRKYNRVYLEATNYVNAHPAETVPLVTEVTKIELANVTKMHRSIIATALDPAFLQPVIDAAARYEYIPRSFPVREILWP